MISFPTNKQAAVLVPLYKTELTKEEHFSFKNTLNILSNWNIFIIAPLRISKWINNYKKINNANFKVKCFANDYFASIDGYNKLMMSKLFYRSFLEYEYLLIVQTDVLVLSDSLKKWCDCKYSYIGAPWFKGFNHPKFPLEFLGVGNGGFSLRRISDFLRVLSVPRYIYSCILYDEYVPFSFRRFFKKLVKTTFFSYNFRPLMPKVNEDVFWGIMVPRCCSFFSVPKPDIASEFSFELEPRYLYRNNNDELPFGCHAWEKYDPDFWRELLIDSRIDLQ